MMMVTTGPTCKLSSVRFFAECVCPANLQLNCGSDGVTYSNHCQRECHRIDLAHEGPCSKDGPRGFRGKSVGKEDQLEADLAQHGANRSDTSDGDNGESDLEDPASSDADAEAMLEEEKMDLPGEEAADSHVLKFLEQATKDGNGDEPRKEETPELPQGKTMESTYLAHGPPGQQTCLCRLKLMPNCGMDGKTYKNHCERECSQVLLNHAKGPEARRKEQTAHFLEGLGAKSRRFGVSRLRLHQLLPLPENVAGHKAPTVWTDADFGQVECCGNLCEFYSYNETSIQGFLTGIAARAQGGTRKRIT
ncbi:protease inhibitor pi2 [Cystoisospora suis]|uniref:Protease inhibitor pi2 n=1 Tax=Cystoisospora suis TaxID=483139 RepID=A0A2C6KPL5_9APIC|nr:protease inhibitor pi2 [Cystoisospora suis]